jgi:hypothetical protein
MELWGAKVLSIKYGTVDKSDAMGDAGNVTNRFLNGTIINNTAEAVIDVRNPNAGKHIRLDLANRQRPRCTATPDDGRVLVAGG